MYRLHKVVLQGGWPPKLVTVNDRVYCTSQPMLCLADINLKFLVQNHRMTSWFPPGWENLEKMGRHFPVREKSGNFVKTGKVREFYSKYWKNQNKLYWKIERNP